jgi:hypothetical protein
MTICMVNRERRRCVSGVLIAAKWILLQKMLRERQIQPLIRFLVVELEKVQRRAHRDHSDHQEQDQQNGGELAVEGAEHGASAT